MYSSDYDNATAFCQTVPFSDPNSYLLPLLDTREGESGRSIVKQGAYELLSLVVEWSIMHTESDQEKTFVLTPLP